MKSTISIFLVLITVALCFFGCSNIPEDPATTAVTNYSYANPYGETVAPPVNTEAGEKVPVQYLETVNNIDFVMCSYNVYGNSVAKMTDIELEYDEFGAFEVSGYASLEMMGIGSRKDNMRIGYTAYDAEGNIVRKSFLQALLKGVNEGDVVKDCRFDFPKDAVKVVFYDYVED